MENPPSPTGFDLGNENLQRVVSVNTAVAGGERSSQESSSPKMEMVSASDQKEQTAGRNSVQEKTPGFVSEIFCRTPRRVRL